MIHIDLIGGDALDLLAGLAPESLDAVITDAPYGLEFMGNKWDAPWRRHLSDARCAHCARTRRGRGRCTCASPAFLASPAAEAVGFQRFSEAWGRAAWRALKPGGALLAFGATRRYHRLVSGLEDAGFEVLDQIDWIYGTGFPKSLDLSNVFEIPSEGDQWRGYGTALKPAHEPIVLARRPLAGTYRENLDRFGTGALGIEWTRVEAPAGDRERYGLDGDEAAPRTSNTYGAWSGAREAYRRPEAGRWPTNTILSHHPDCEPPIGTDASGCVEACPVRWLDEQPGGEGSRFFPTFRYEAKPTREERDLGLESLPAVEGGAATKRKEGSAGTRSPRAGAGRTGGARNTHPTVKPVALMRWLVRLVTKPGDVVCDPFVGSGTSAIACKLERVHCLGFENDPRSLEIARLRVAAADEPILRLAEQPAEPVQGTLLEAEP